jgi:NAD(P)-dependent dehydrogenase (short-subunit alcohol dehydrogenase family)
MPRVFLITGTSTGFGKYYAQEVLDQGDYVVATARDPSQLEFKGTTAENYLAVRLDVTDKKTIEEAFTQTLAKFQRVDVVVNNAGYGLSGCFEEYTEAQIRQQFEINFFGLLDVTRTAMEVLRDRQKPRGGLIQQITSIGGQRGVPYFSVYCASKWAVEGFTEAVSHEVKPEWGIKFTLIEPGGFRYVPISYFIFVIIIVIGNFFFSLPSLLPFLSHSDSERNPKKKIPYPHARGRTTP